MDRKLLRKADIFIIAAVIVAAAALWLAFTVSGKLEAVVTVDGEVLRTVDLSSGEAAEFRTGTDPDLLIIARDAQFGWPRQAAATNYAPPAANLPEWGIRRCACPPAR